MKQYLAGFSIFLLAASANAQSSFSGLSVFGTLNLQTSAAKLTDTGTSTDGLGKSGMGATIGADYGLDVGNNVLLLLGGTYDVAEPSVFDSVNGIATNRTVGGKFKGHWSLYAAPGVEVTKDLLAYVKFGYHSTKFSGTGVASGLSTKHSGFSYGVGTRFNLNPSTYLNLEIQQLNYSGKDSNTDFGTVTPTATIGSVGLGYRF